MSTDTDNIAENDQNAAWVKLVCDWCVTNLGRYDADMYAYIEDFILEVDDDFWRETKWNGTLSEQVSAFNYADLTDDSYNIIRREAINRNII